MRKKFEETFKARVAIEAIKCEKTLSQISSEYGVHSNLVSRWKQELLKGAAEVFGKGNNSNKIQRYCQMLWMRSNISSNSSLCSHLLF